MPKLLPLWPSISVNLVDDSRKLLPPLEVLSFEAEVDADESDVDVLVVMRSNETPVTLVTWLFWPLERRILVGISGSGLRVDEMSGGGGTLVMEDEMS